MHQGKTIKCSRSNRGDEYLLGESRQFLKDHEITSQKSTPCLLKQEGIAERRNNYSLGYGKIIDELYMYP